MTALFDLQLRALRRDRAARKGAALFLYERVFADCLERIGLVQRRFQKALLIGCPDPAWPQHLRAIGPDVDVIDPGALFAANAGGSRIDEDRWSGAGPNAYELVLAIGTFDTVDDLPRMLSTVRGSMSPDSLLIGAVPGGDNLPRLRMAMRAADQLRGEALPHVHPRIEASQLAPLLSAAGFSSPVVDVDRVAVVYPDLAGLIADLRAMGATNVLSQRPRQPILRRALEAAAADFDRKSDHGRTVERFEILHFAAWTPADPSIPNSDAAALTSSRQ